MSLTAQAKKRLLLISLIAVVVVCGGGGALTFQIIRHRQMYEQEKIAGLDAAKRGDDVAVVNQLANYLRRYPSDMEALTAFAHSRIKSQVRPDAAVGETINALRRILTLDPTRNDERRQLMEVFSTFGYQTEALEQAMALLAALPGDAEASEVQIKANMALHHYKEALDAANARVAAAPTDWIAQMEKLQVLQQQNSNSDVINTTVSQAIAGHENEQGALFLKGFGARLTSDANTAQVAFKAASTQPSTDVEVAQNLVEQLDEMSLHAEAMNVLGDLVKKGGIRPRLMWLRRLWEDGRVGDAAAFAGSPLGTDLTDATSLGIYADSLRRIGKDNSEILAKLDARKDDLRSIAWAAILRAQAKPSQDTVKLARTACEAALKGTRLDQEYIVYFLANFEATLGDINLAIDHWGRAAVEFSTHSWAIPLVQRAQAQLAQNHLADAETSIKVAINRAGGQEFIAITLARIWYAQYEAGDETKLVPLTGLIDEIQKHDPNEEQSGIIRAALQGRAGQKDQAVATINAILGKTPPPAAQTLTTLSDISRKYGLGLEEVCLEQYNKQFGVTAQVSLAQAIDDFRKTNSRDGGLKLLQDRAAAATPQTLPYFGLAIATFREATADPNSINEWKAVGDKYPKELNIQRGILISQAAYGDRDFYDRTINRVKALAGDASTTWKLARARWLLDGPQTPQASTDAQTLLDDVLKAEPQSVPALVLSSEAKSRLGDVNGAADMLTKAKQLDPNSSMMSLSLAQMLQVRGDFEKAHEQLEQAASDKNATPDFKERTAVLLASQGDVARAISILEPMITDGTATESVKLHLAAFYCRVKEFSKAQAISDDLMKKPDASTVVLAAQIQMFQRQPAAAEKIMEQLTTLNLPPSRLEQTRGDFYYMFGRMDMALAHYSASTQPAPTESTPWLSLIDTQVAMGNAAAVPGIVNEALKHVRDKDQLLAIQKQNDLLIHIGGTRTERQLLADLIKNPTDDNPAVKVLNVVIPLEVGNASPNEILQKLQQLSVDLPRYLPALTGLTEAQLRFGRCEDAIQSANRAAAAFPNDPWPTQLATRALSLTGRWDEALAAAKAWRERVVGDTLNADLAISEIQLHLHDADGALETLKKYDNMPELETDQKWQVLLTDARAMVMQNKPDDAGNLLWDTVKSTPSVRSTWQTFVMLYLPPAQAEVWLRKLSAQMDAEKDSGRQQIVLAQSWDILARRTGSQDDAKLARDIVAKMEADPTNGAYAAFAAGTFSEEDGDFVGAQAAYRRALSRQANLTDAKNNLAELLANHGGDIKEAVDLAQQCVKESPTASCYDTLADIQGLAKNYDAALDAITQATQAEPDGAKWRVHLAKLLAEAGKTDQAKLAIAELDLMTPGVKSLPQNYRDELDALRKQLNSPSVSVTH
jgi:predicted Zn-dependent protease